ncbi:hypothetical protein PHYSODRAFT_528437 [Phytophthora sojae]|uniref:Uncharacterized protein n=1 Tax=Phytophthora sojae (strain P6497) TaxID=1094619 RepID=G5A9Q4_PHYSP|nr:hypothetical protein PHYSODRAFT_528437 [Phytophthora sojae]EGZ07334.1 hypothetical protein PHYSODRAFT_528437 [Phytophthora sojae]|eukprot:XP_009536900.1 hypothetical protein PHYSODRAFT_528437 [Phytophthora sojae]
MADAASRAWTDPYKTVWTNFSVSWEQTAVPPIFRKLYTNFSKDFNPAHWPRHQTLNTQLLGHSGCDGPRKCDCLNGYPLFAIYCWKFGWNSSERGNSTSTVPSKLCHISWYHKRFVRYKVGLSPGHQLAVVGMRREDPPTNPKAPSPCISSENCTAPSIFPVPSTESSGGLRCWASSFFCAAPSV